jgi:hypothetical protein
MRVGNLPHNSTQLLETLFAFVTKINYVSVAVASPRTLTEKQATLLASRRERHYELFKGIAYVVYN